MDVSEFTNDRRLGSSVYRCTVNGRKYIFRVGGSPHSSFEIKFFSGLGRDLVDL